MKTAYAYWNNRIAPVFDSAHQIYVVDTENGEIISEQQYSLPDTAPFQKAAHLADLGIKTLVCGAISRPLHEWLVTRGVNCYRLCRWRLARSHASISGGQSCKQRLCHARMRTSHARHGRWNGPWLRNRNWTRHGR